LCGACKTNDECGGGAHGGPFCNVATGACMTCDVDFGGEGASACPESAPHCNARGDAAGVCGACASNADCANGSGATTHSGPICNVGSGRCGACDGDGEVSMSAYGCTNASAPTCLEGGACGMCASDADCVNPVGVRLHARATCNVTTGMCEGAPAAVTFAGEASDGTGGADASSGACSATSRGDGGKTEMAIALVALLGVASRRRKR
jgi:MYXO-CTERM domain-containing protein